MTAPPAVGTFFNFSPGKESDPFAVWRKEGVDSAFSAIENIFVIGTIHRSNAEPERRV